MSRSDRYAQSKPLLTILLVALGLALALPGGAFAAPGSQATTQAVGRGAPAGGFSINIYKADDFVSQATPYWCIGASMQMMLNMLDVTEGDDRASQEANMRAARSNGPRAQEREQATEFAGGALRGAGSAGWARGLTELGAGYYTQRAVDGYSAALRIAVDAVRRTNRPVGLIVWRGAHAWVMSGFTSTADPLVDPDYRITGVYIQDPWYPRVSSIWGPGQEPNSWISVSNLKADFLPRRAGQRHADQAGKYVLVLPIDPQMPAAREERMI